MKDATCANRVDAHYDGRMADLRMMLDPPDGFDADERAEVATAFGFDIPFDIPEDMDDDDIREKLRDSWYEYGLCFEFHTEEEDEPKPGYFRFQLSTGGPGDEFRFFAGPDLDLWKVEYWFLDWFDGAHKLVVGDDLKLLRQVWEEFRETGTAQKALKDATE